MIIGMNQTIVPKRTAEQLDCSICYDLIRVHVLRRSSTSLENIYHKTGIKFAVNDLLSASYNCLAFLSIESAQSHVSLGCRKLNDALRPNKFSRELQTTDRKIV